MFQVRTVAANSPERWTSVFRLLGLIGFVAALAPSTVREATGRERANLRDGSALLGSIRDSGYTGLYSARIDEVKGKDLFAVNYYASLRKAAAQDSEAAPGGELMQGRLVRRLGSEEVKVFDQKQTWWKVRTLDGIEGFAPETGFTELKAGSQLNLYAADTLSVGPETQINIAAALAAPFRFFLLFNVYLVLYLPGLFFSIVYLAAALVVYPLNLLHAFVLQRNNDELDQFFRRFIQNQFKLSTALAGWTSAVPHVDLYGSEKTTFANQIHVPASEGMDRTQVMIRLLLPYAVIAGLWFILKGLRLYGIADWWDSVSFPAFFYHMKMVFAAIVAYWLLYSMHFGGPHYVRAFPHIAILGLIAIAAGAAAVVQWGSAAFRGDDIEPLSRLQLHYWRSKASVQAACFGLTSDLPRVQELFSGGEESETTAPVPGRVSMNLAVLVILLAASGGLYGLFWLARVARLMSDDAFTIICVAVAGGLLPLSFVLSRYYRRAEALTKMNPSWIIEILLMIPFVNLALGPFVIQYLLNHYERLKAQAG